MDTFYQTAPSLVYAVLIVLSDKDKRRKDEINRLEKKEFQDIPIIDHLIMKIRPFER